MKRLMLVILLAWASAVWAIQPGRVLPVEIQTVGQQFILSDVVESLTASELYFPVRVTAYPEALEVPVLFQIGTVAGLTPDYQFSLTLRDKNGRALFTDFSSTRGRTAVAKVWGYMKPLELYQLTVKFPPSGQVTRHFLGVGLWKYWVPKFNQYIKIGKQGDGHTGEFR